MEGIKRPRRNHTIIRRQAREVIYNVLKFMQKEKSTGTKNLHQVRRRIAEATGVSVQTVSRVVNETKISSLRSSGKKKEKLHPITDVENNLYKGTFRRCILNLHINKETPTLQKILHHVQSETNFKGCRSSVRKIIYDLGFRWRITETNKKILIEKHDVHIKRIEYLKKIKKYKEEGRDIIYTGVHYIKGTEHNTIVSADAWSGAGFIPNVLLMFQLGTTSGDYQHDMNFENYEKWLRTLLLPKLRANSVVVIDNAPYNNKLKNIVPTLNSTKADMESWLCNKGIPYTKDLLKPELYKLILLYEQNNMFKSYMLDDIFEEFGLIVLRLPPNHPDLNPMEIVWSEMKEYVTDTKVEMDTQTTMQFIRDRRDRVDPQQWFAMYRSIEEIEDLYIYVDQTMETIIDNLKIHDEFGDNSTGSENESENESTDSEFENMLSMGSLK